MDANRISVARILELGVPLTWHEAVAVTQEVAVVSVVNATLNGSPCLVDVDTCFITRRGDVELPVPSDTEPGDAAQHLLRALLAGREIPTDLEALAFGPPSKNLGDDLAQFSRPNRRAEIASLAQRALKADVEFHAAPAPPRVEPPPVPPAASSMADVVMHAPTETAARPEEEVDRLRSEVVSRSEPPNLPEAHRAKRKPGVDLRVAAAVAAVAIAGGVALWLRPAAAAEGATATEAAAPEAAPEPASPEATPPPTAGDGPAIEGVTLPPITNQPGDIEIGKGRARTALDSIASDTYISARASGSSTPPRGASSASSLSPGLPAVAAPTPSRAEIEALTATDAATTAAFADTSVYSWNSDGVQPPVMTYPRMPREAFPPPSDEVVQGPHFEILVSETGSVEAVRFRGQHSPSENVYRYRMLLAAAKVWEFKPAMRDGRPVRYVMRVIVNEN